MIGKNVASIALLALGGCASIVGSTSQPITVNSTPSEAEILIRDENGTEVYRGKTPTTVTLKKSGGYFNGRDYTVSFTKEGYGPQTATIASGPNGWYILGNLVFGGLIGWLIVDPATGAMWTLSPNMLTVTLPQSAGPATQPDTTVWPGDRGTPTSQNSPEPAFQLATIDAIDPALRDHLVRLR